MPATAKPPPKIKTLALSAEEYNDLLQFLTPVSLPIGQTLYNIAEGIEHIYDS
jgi:hypothetical protein